MKKSTEMYLKGTGKLGLAIGRVGIMFAEQAITGKPPSAASRGRAAVSFSSLIHDGEDLLEQASALRKKGQ